MKQFRKHLIWMVITAIIFLWSGLRGHAIELVKTSAWQERRIRQGDGQGGWITRPALRQVIKHPDANYTMPFGLVQMDNGEIALLCSREKIQLNGNKTFEPIIAFSKDSGATWSDFMIIPGTTGRPQYLEWLGGGRLSFITEVFNNAGEPQRIFSIDYGRTWTESVEHPLTKDGMSFNVEGNAWIDRDKQGNAAAILELGWHYAPGKKHPADDATVVFRRSVDRCITWVDEVAPPQWKFIVEHNGRKWLRGVSEGAIVRAANGDLVAALRTDMPPRYFDEPNDDSLEGTAVSISHDNGKTWSEMQFLFDAGRHHPNLQRLPNGDIVCTLIVRDDIQNGKLATHRRGCDALISKDNGRTWNIDRRFELDRFKFLRADGYWIDGMCGHIASVVLNDGYIISAYGQYQLGASVLIKWKPDAGPVQPVPRVGIQLGPKAGEVERYAADELAGYLDKLFNIDITPTVEHTSSADILLLVGTPGTNPAISQAIDKEDAPKVSDQGIILKHIKVPRFPADKNGSQIESATIPALVISGGSPAATLWAVYELAGRWGVHYLLHGDVLPENTGSFHLPHNDVVLEPNLRVRQWRVVNDFAMGPESWGIEEYRRVIDQLAKLRFNRIFLSIYPYQPFLDLKIQGISRQSAFLWYNYHYPITDDMPGRNLFGNVPEFWNPDLPRNAGYPEFAAAGERLIKGIIAHAHRRGMECAMNATVTEFPPEFAPLLPDAEKVKQLEAMNIVPGKQMSVDDPAVRELAKAVLQATIDTYPGVNYILLGMPEFRQWVDQYEKAWQALDVKYHLNEKVKLEDVIAAAAKRTDYPGGAQRAVQETKGDIVLLYFYDRLLTDLRAMQGTRWNDIKFIINSVAEELFPVLPRILPPGSETLNFVDYTPARILKRREVLGQILAHELPTSLIYTLHDDNIGVIPQLSTGSLHEITKDLRRYGWAGFSTRYWLIGDHDPCMAYLARAAWDANATPDAVYRDQIRAVYGDVCMDDMLTVWRELEAATVQLEWYGLGFTFPVPGMLMKHWQPKPLPAELAQVRDYYDRALSAAHLAQEKISPFRRTFVDYWIGRLEFGIGYFDAVNAVRNAARAENDGQREEARRYAGIALQRVCDAIEAYARVAGDQSDRGAIATMAEYVYRPIKEKVSELQK